MRGLRALLGYLWSHRWQTALGVFGLLVADLAHLAMPFLAQRVIDQLTHKVLDLRPVGLAVVMAGVAYLARCLWRYCLFGVARHCDIAIRRRIYQKAVSLSLTDYQSRSIGHIMSLATGDVAAVRMVLAFALMSSFDAIILGCLSIWALFRLDAHLALLTLLPFPLMGLLMKYLMRWNYSSWDRVQQSLDQLTEKGRESISGMRVLRLHVQGSGDAAVFAQACEEQFQRFMHYVLIDGLYAPSITLLSGLSAAMLLWLGGDLVSQNRLTLGEFTAFATLLAQLSWPMVAVGWTLSLVQRGVASMERILHLLEQPGEPQGAGGPREGRTQLPLDHQGAGGPREGRTQLPLDHQGAGGPREERTPLPLDHQGAALTPRALAPGELRVEHLSFSYPGAAEPALVDLSFHLKPGESLGLVGEVGAGKSTLTRLLLRLYQPPSGSIWLDGQDIKELELQYLRQQMALVEQEAFLFSASIQDNLQLSGSDGMLEAAQAAQLHQEVLSFALGYHTLLGERGITLSGGQRQRLSLARALLKSAPILLLDDTLSAVDADTEERILQHLRQRQGRQTLVMISHRVSAVRHLDQILVLKQGRVIQRGSHQELMQQSGLYRDLAELQSRQQGSRR